MITGRLIVAIISTLLEETALVVIVRLGLPRLGVDVPFAGLIILMVVWGVFSVFIYRRGSQALRQKPVICLPIIGSKGKVVSPLVPEGMVRIQGELWIATGVGRKAIGEGTKITVVEQDGLRLVVRETIDSETNGAV